MTEKITLPHWCILFAPPTIMRKRVLQDALSYNCQQLKTLRNQAALGCICYLKIG